MNAAGGVHGRKIEVVVKDDGYVAARAAANAKEFVESGSVFCIGHLHPGAVVFGLSRRTGGVS